MTLATRHLGIPAKVPARLMKDYGGFNHNSQSLRIVTTLENRYPDFAGKFELGSAGRHGKAQKTDYDIAEAKQFNPELTGIWKAQIANLADDLAYTSHDLDDGLRSA